jgi:signal transduction histidine kinase
LEKKKQGCRECRARLARANTRLKRVLVNLTARKRMEQQLRRTLEKENELRENGNRLLATAFHEFRTPLTTIITSTELLQYYHFRWSEEKEREILSRISQSANKLIGFLEGMLVYNRVEEGHREFSRSKLNLSARCRDLVNSAQSSAGESKTVRFLEIGKRQEAVFLDENLFGFILKNLLSNALKFSKPGGQVTVELEWQPEDVVLRVRDEGIGIPLKDQGKVFKPFQRASNARTIPGTGFGLAIVKQSVLVHRGRIWLESVEGQGTTFTVSLPLFDSAGETG